MPERDIIKHINDGTELVTVPAINAVARKLYQSMGFEAYNYAI